MRLLLSPSALFALFDAADHARRARLVFQWATERLLNEVEACMGSERVHVVVLPGGRVEHSVALLPYGEIADWLSDGGGFELQALERAGEGEANRGT